MENNRPKRRKDKYNPYTLMEKDDKYYVSFTDSNHTMRVVEVTKDVFDAYDSFELDDLSILNEYDRHYSSLELLKNYPAVSANGESVDDIILKKFEAEKLREAISKLPEIQKRRLQKHYFEEKSFKDIADEEGCNYQPIQRSVYRAITQIKKYLKNFEN